MSLLYKVESYLQYIEVIYYKQIDIHTPSCLFSGTYIVFYENAMLLMVYCLCHPSLWSSMVEISNLSWVTKDWIIDNCFFIMLFKY